MKMSGSKTNFPTHNNHPGTSSYQLIGQMVDYHYLAAATISRLFAHCKPQRDCSQQTPQHKQQNETQILFLNRDDDEDELIEEQLSNTQHSSLSFVPDTSSYQLISQVVDYHYLAEATISHLSASHGAIALNRPHIASNKGTANANSE